LLRHNGPEHCFVFAPTRSGKGVGIVIPTLLSWRASVLVYDMKRENWDITAGWRKQFSHVLRFEPTAAFSVRFNPLLEVRKGENEVRDVQNIADILVDPDGSKDRMDHWEKTGHSLLVGAILHVLYAEPDKTLTGVAKFLSDPDRPFFKTLNHMLQCRHLGDRVHPVVASAARELLNKSENELSGVLSTAMSFLGLYRDPIISRNTAVSDFTIVDLMNAKNPVSLYIVVPPSDADRTRPLIRLMLNQIGRRLTESMGQDGKSHRHDLLMLLDEFPTLGRLTFFESELAYMAGYGIRALLIAQSLNQIEKAYGSNNSILDNSHIRVTYGTLDDRTAKRISEMLGTATENRRQTNYAGHRLAPWLGHVMVSEQESPRALLTPGEVLQFPANEALVMVGGNPPYRGLKVRYYEDRRFMGRARLPRPDAAELQGMELKGLGLPNAWLQLPAPTVEPEHPSGANRNAASAEIAGGVLLEGEIQHNPEWGISVDDRQQPEKSKPKLEMDDGHQDAEKRKMRELEQQRTERNRQLGRQRAIEQSRQPSGGGMPL
jgi:type IV secretion system protein VirD4